MQVPRGGVTRKAAKAARHANEGTFDATRPFLNGTCFDVMIGFRLTFNAAAIARSTRFVATIWRTSGQIPTVSKAPNSRLWSSHPEPRVASIDGNKQGASRIPACRYFHLHRHMSTPRTNLVSCTIYLLLQTTCHQKEHPILPCGRKRFQSSSALPRHIHMSCTRCSLSPRITWLGVNPRTK